MNQRVPARHRAWWNGIIFLLLLLSALAAVFYRLCFPGITFLRTFQNPEIQETPFVVTSLTIPAGERLIPAKLYLPDNGFDRAVLLVHGVHYRGYEEARLTRLARNLARRGTLVLTPEIEDLKNFDIVPRAVDDIETAALFLLDNPVLGTVRLPHRPGLFGISFAGGLGLVAAASPALNGKLGYVFSFGGHPALSPTKNPVPACPLFLLHGSVDNVIPASETLALERWAEGLTPTRALVSELIRHVELENQPKERPGLKDTYKLVRFMTELLRH